MVAPVPDVDSVVGELVARVSGFGPLQPFLDDPAVGELVARVSGFGPLQPFLDDPAVEEIWINDPDPARVQVRALVHLLSPQGVRGADSLCLGRQAA